VPWQQRGKAGDFVIVDAGERITSQACGSMPFKRAVWINVGSGANSGSWAYSRQNSLAMELTQHVEH